MNYGEGGDSADSAVSALFAMQGSKEIVNMDHHVAPPKTGGYMCYITVGSGAAVHADIDDDDEDDDHNDMGYYNSDRSPVSVGAATPSSGKKGGRGGSGGHVADPEERLQRSRERNRMHARKTRQRKKLQMQTLQVRAEELKLEQLRLKQIINDRKTANILLEITSASSPTSLPSLSASPQLPAVFNSDIELILKRHNDDIPDGKKIMQETTAMVPSHKAKLIRSMSVDDAVLVDDFDSPGGGKKNLTMNGKFPNDGIDYALLSRDRNKCTPQELDRIRKERNRMHAKRTRDRKKIFIQEMLNVIQVLDAENLKLRALIQQYYPENTFSMSTQPPPPPSSLPPPPTPTAYYVGTNRKTSLAGIKMQLGQSPSNMQAVSSSSLSAKTSSDGDNSKTGSSMAGSSMAGSSKAKSSASSSTATHGRATRSNTMLDAANVATSANTAANVAKRKQEAGVKEEIGMENKEKRLKTMVNDDRNRDGASPMDYSNSSDDGNTTGTSSDGHTDVQSNTTSTNNTSNKSSEASSVASDSSES